MAACAGAVRAGRSEGFAEIGQYLLLWGRSSRISRARRNLWPGTGQVARAAWSLAAILLGLKVSLPVPTGQV